VFQCFELERLGWAWVENSEVDKPR